MAAVVVLKNNTRLYLWNPEQAVTAENRLGNITQLGDVGGEAEEIDTTAIDSMAREFELGFTDNGSVDVTQNVTESEYQTMVAIKDAGTTMNFGISAFNKSGTQVIGIQGQCVVRSATLTGISVGGLLQVNSSLRVSGAITQDFVDPSGAEGAKKVTGIAVAGTGEATSVAVDGTLQMIATITPADASNKAVTWGVDDGTKASISATGLLTGKAAGTVNVYAVAKDGSGILGTTAISVTE